MTERVPRPFVTALADLTQWLEAAGVPAMIVGGIAASILGRPRATRDIDALAVAPEDQWMRLLGSSKTHGILPRIENALEFARRTRVLLLRHTESGIDIDIILGGLPFEAEAVSRATVHDLSGVRVRLPQGRSDPSPLVSRPGNRSTTSAIRGYVKATAILGRF